MKFDFDPAVAKEVWVEEAIMYSNIKRWCEKNKANGKHYYDGYYRTYNSMEAFCKLFTFWTFDQIRRILKNLEDKKYIKTWEYNTNKYDRTKWYTPLVDFQHSICVNPQMDLSEPTNDITYTDNKPNNKTYRGNFYPPTLEEIVDYCKSRGNEVDPEKRYNFYASKWRMVGKNKMVNRRAAVRTREKKKDIDEIFQEYKKSQEDITPETKPIVWKSFIDKYWKDKMQKVLDKVNEWIGTFIANL